MAQRKCILFLNPGNKKSFLEKKRLELISPLVVFKGTILNESDMLSFTPSFIWVQSSSFSLLNFLMLEMISIVKKT